MTSARRTIHTANADIAVADTGGTGTPVLLIHGNSNGKDVFREQLEAPELRNLRLIAMDLPGHGDSSDAVDPAAYSIAGYADAAFAVLEGLGVAEAVVMGWSLGGHIGIEMLSRGHGVRGLMIVGTPPTATGILGLMRGFHVSLGLLLATRARLTPVEMRRFAAICFGESADERVMQMIARTDVRARPALFWSMMKGMSADQRSTVEQAPEPIAVVNGDNEPFARLDYLEGIQYGNLWRGRCHVLDGAGHAPFLQTPAAFNELLGAFVADVAARPQAAPTTIGQCFA
jgi:pimeloyl-ACP methyl ester carboxylesterase